jgi:hypothetical protein
MGPGAFTVTESVPAGFIVDDFLDACTQTATGLNEATGTISAGQTLTCTIENAQP